MIDSCLRVSAFIACISALFSAIVTVIGVYLLFAEVNIMILLAGLLGFTFNVAMASVFYYVANKLEAKL